jgi:hypothetical protein
VECCVHTQKLIKERVNAYPGHTRQLVDQGIQGGIVRPCFLSPTCGVIKACLCIDNVNINLFGNNLRTICI